MRAGPGEWPHGATAAARTILVTLLLAGAAATPASYATAQDADTSALNLPSDATSLEGLPTVSISTTAEGALRRQLTPEQAASHRLAIRIARGALYWSSRDDRRLTLASIDGFTYLWSGEPGRYVRIQRLNDRLTYVEHVDTPSGSVTFWGELRVVLRK